MQVSTLSIIILVLVFGLIVFQEAVNGFHDVANAIATVIYANALTPLQAVGLAATCNFFGVLFAGTAVAFSLVYLLPLDMVAGINTRAEASLLLAMIITAVAWNFGTWWLAIPSSTTHAYVGSILGVSLAHAYIVDQPIATQVNWHQGETILLALLLSPVLGLLLGAILLWGLRRMRHKPEFFASSQPGQRPAFWVRAGLISGSAGVALLHGSNDGQKSIGLMMVVLFGLAPALYGLDPARLSANDQAQLMDSVRHVAAIADQHQHVKMTQLAQSLGSQLEQEITLKNLQPDQAVMVRESMLALFSELGEWLHAPQPDASLTPDQSQQLSGSWAVLKDFIEHVPLWVVLLSALALGGGTAFGYQKIVRTLGEGMGSARMSPAQGVAAQTSAIISIAMADGGGMPVSTTHVLSSAVVGTVVATPGQLVNRSMLKRILMTWVTTLPCTMLLAFVLGLGLHWLLA